jgi:hypothetical protein
LEDTSVVSEKVDQQQIKFSFSNKYNMVFVDYKQAYDSIHREELWKAMITFDIPKKLCNAKTIRKVKFLGELSSGFEINLGLRQDNALFPTPIFLEKVIRELTQKQKVETVDKNRY